MQRLWAPWRVGYITKVINKQHKGCVFCRIAKDQKDSKNFIFLRGNFCFVVLNTFPYGNGHCLILPKRHVGDIDRLTDDEIKEMMELLIRAKDLLQKTINPQGYNVGLNLGRIAGAGIPKHLHMHVVPRWSGDHNFMPVISGTKVISQSLKAIYQLLTDANQKRLRRVRR